MDLEIRKGGCEAQSSFLSEGGRVKMFNGVEGDFPMPDAALVGWALADVFLGAWAPPEAACVMTI